ncbi:MAG: hypothetical protein ACI83Y_001975 [Candidatus Azotimanducaceae bacterium]
MITTTTATQAPSGVSVGVTAMVGNEVADGDRDQVSCN